MKFFVTGLPRSRTYWFSQYFSGIEGVYCYHELINGLSTKEQFYNLMNDDVMEFIGNSDSGLYITDFQEKWVESRTVIIDRPIKEVKNSLDKFLPKFGYACVDMELLVTMKSKLDNFMGLRVPFDYINGSLDIIHDYIGIPFNKAYADYMSGLNMQLSELHVNSNSYKLWEKV